MEFTDQYLTYDEYRTLGGILDEMPFNLLEYNARKEIDLRTLNRLQGIGNNYNEVKMCMYNMIVVLNSYDNYVKQDKSIASESIDGYSVSYSGNVDNSQKIKNEIDDVIYKYLFGLIINNQHVLCTSI